jgi:predicted deacylase
MKSDADSGVLGKLPDFPVHIAPVDLSPYLAGNAGIPGVWRLASGAPGPNLVVTSLIHGNEIAGAAALVDLLRAPPPLRRGTLHLVFANLDAYARFDPANPTASRFADEDMNRLWEPCVLEGPRVSRELVRARLLRPLVDRADVLLDLHSMLWPSDPLILCGPTPKGRALGMAAGTPPLVVADHGHVSGRRLIDYAPFVDQAGPRTAILVEAGQHWQAPTVQAMLATVHGVLQAAGMTPATASAAAPRPRCAEVTMAVTALSGGFTFVRPFRGGDVIAHRNTLIATDGAVEVRTPHDDCLLIMPSLRPSRGHTAVRLARFVTPFVAQAPFVAEGHQSG